MNNKEAIDMLEEMQHDAFINNDWQQREALCIAIRALYWYDEFLKAMEKKQDEYWKSFKFKPEWIVRYPEEYDEWKYRPWCTRLPIGPKYYYAIRTDSENDE